MSPDTCRFSASFFMVLFLCTMGVMCAAGVRDFQAYLPFTLAIILCLFINLTKSTRA